MDTTHLHPLRGAHPVRVVTRSLSCRFRHEDHQHHVQLYPETGMVQVKWQHRVPVAPELARLGLAAPSLTYEAETCWYTLHSVPDGFGPRWEVLEDGSWVPLKHAPRAIV